MNTIFFFPFLIIVVLAVALLLLLPFWFKSRLPGYLQSHPANTVYAAILAIFGLILSPVCLIGWGISVLGLLETTTAFDPTGNRLHDWSLSLYGHLFSLRWSSLIAVLLLFGASVYFWREELKRKKR